MVSKLNQSEKDCVSFNIYLLTPYGDIKLLCINDMKAKVKKWELISRETMGPN